MDQPPPASLCCSHIFSHFDHCLGGSGGGGLSSQWNDLELVERCLIIMSMEILIEMHSYMQSRSKPACTMLVSISAREPLNLCGADVDTL